MTEYTTRPATAPEIIELKSLEIRHGRPVQFRHFVKEVPSPRARNGVAHREYARSKIYIEAGVPMVRYHGKMVAVTASFITFADGRTTLFDLRIDSPHLKAAA